MNCIATCGFGMEAPVRDELKRMGITVTKVEDARVYFTATREEVVRANLWLRCADRVMVELASFHAERFAELFDGVRALPWGRILPKDASFIVTGKSALSKLFSVRDIQSLSKKAIADAMMAAYGYPSCPENGARYNVDIGILRDEVSVCVNTSGPGLNRRGYRDFSSVAPLRETLGATLVMLSRYDDRDIFIDPCCGSGTIVIEAAMIAANVAPGLQRTFAFDNWNTYAQAAKLEREAAMDARRESGFPHLMASDIDPDAVSMARRHARRAGVNGLINFSVGNVKHLEVPENGLIVTNPPYGLRMDVKQAKEVAQALGKLQEKTPSISVNAISQDEEFEQAYGKRADKRRKLYNGGVKCNFYMFYRQKKQSKMAQK